MWNHDIFGELKVNQESVSCGVQIHPALIDRNRSPDLPLDQVRFSFSLNPDKSQSP